MKILIVDDEPLARMRLGKMLTEMGFNDLIEAENGRQAIERVAAESPQLVFMDIQMPVMDGVAAAQRIKQDSPDCCVVFCTAYDEYAIKAFELDALDYMLKPVNKQRLQQAIRKTGLSSDACLTIKRGQDTLNINLNRIACFIADGKYVSALVESSEYIVDESLVQLEKKYAGLFVRIHRNALVNRHHLVGIHHTPDNQYQALLRDSDSRPLISRRNLKLIKDIIHS